MVLRLSCSPACDEVEHHSIKAMGETERFSSTSQEAQGASRGVSRDKIYL